MFELKSERSVVICHARGDAELAHDLGSFLARNCAVILGYEEIAADLLNSVERATSADVVLAVLSPASVPRTWKREEWEPVFFDAPEEFGTKIACVLAGECDFPKLLRRKNFFDCSAGCLEGMRAGKRWLLESDGDKVVLPSGITAAELRPGELDRLHRSVGDQPGIEHDVSREAALAYARASTRDFEGVFWIDCRQRTRCGVLGDTAHALGARTPDTIDRNRKRLCDLCLAHRVLLLFADLDPTDRDLVCFGGKASVIFTNGWDRPRKSLEEITRLFHAWPSNLEACLAALGDAQGYLWETRGSAVFGPALVALLKHFDRLAEAYEVLTMLAAAAREQNDPFRAHQLEWEQSWIAEQWGHAVEFNPPRQESAVEQLSLF
ncbi:MAG: toll/interleukin-1 receptor domain-containing protein [Bryobacterales bacterium]|nr:toll/interleukin-1 receptor domain-containing protein [Bryobacterales bacterium]MBV9396577.1 toll/interleukin-1 receptor domain-containing protein [Bryobacterales bacterium]